MRKPITKQGWFGTRRRTATGAALVAGVMLPVLAAAQTDNAQFTVEVVIEGSCTVTNTSGSNIDFGTETSPIAAALTPGQIALDVECTTAGQPFSLQLDGSNDAGGTFRMANGGVFVDYNLYQDSVGGTAWTPGVALNSSVTAGNSPEAIPIIPELPAGAYISGSYSDTVTATLTF